MTTSRPTRALLLAALLPAGLLAGNSEPAWTPAGSLSCSAPFELQWLRDLDFGTIAASRKAAGQVDVEPDGAYRQLGGAFVSSPPGAAEFSFCGPPKSRFAVQIDAGSELGPAGAGARSARLAPGSVRFSAMGAELQRIHGSLWEGVVGPGGRVTLRVGARLDIPAGSVSSRPSVRFWLALRIL